MICYICGIEFLGFSTFLFYFFILKEYLFESYNILSLLFFVLSSYNPLHFDFFSSGFLPWEWNFHWLKVSDFPVFCCTILKSVCTRQDIKMILIFMLKVFVTWFKRQKSTISQHQNPTMNMQNNRLMYCKYETIQFI